MRVGVNLPVAARPTRESLRDVAIAAERLGFDSVWANSHTAIPAVFEPRYPYSPDGVPAFGAESDWADALISLGFAAAVTERVRLGTCVIPLITTDPLTLAKQAATVDLLSGGRLELGIGAGWMAEEGQVLGHPTNRRTARMAETIEILRLAWSRPTFSYSGALWQLPEVGVHPQPIQGDRVPLWLGGHGDAVISTAARFGAGLLVWVPEPEQLRGYRDKLRAANPACPLAASLSLSATAGRWRETATALRDAGADLLILTRRYTPEGFIEDLEIFAAQVLPEL